MPLKSLACVLILSGASLAVHAQNQQARSQPDWPCSGQVDPAYVRTAEASGGKVLLFKPAEVTGLAAENAASRAHPETVLRVAGPLDTGVHAFEVPLDSTVGSVYVFASLQCLQDVTLSQPSGDPLPLDSEGVVHQAFAAIHLFTIKAPAPGRWKITVAGRGFFTLVVAAQTRLALRSVSLLRDGVAIKGLAPLGQPVRLQTAVSGEPRGVTVRFISMGGAPIADIPVTPEEPASGMSTYAADVTLPAADFRVLLTGIDANGFAFQRVTPQLFVGGQ